jgi:hypothetical protein
MALVAVLMAGGAHLLVGVAPASASPTTAVKNLSTGMSTNYDWARLVLMDGHWPTGANNMVVMEQWMASENFPTAWWAPPWTSAQKKYLYTKSRNNPLNCGLTTTPGGLGTYTSLTTAAYFVAKQLHYTTATATRYGYPAIAADLARTATPTTTAETIQDSDWAASHYGYGTSWYGWTTTKKVDTRRVPASYPATATFWGAPTTVKSVTAAPGSNGSTEELFALTAKGTVYEKWLQKGLWRGWADFGGEGFVGSVTYADGPTGTTQELFAMSSNGTVWENAERPSGSWSGWADLGGQGFKDTVTWAPGSNGSTQELFAVASSGTVWENYELGGKWSGWYVRGPQTFDGSVTFAPGSNGSTQELFALASNGTVDEQWELPHGSWSGWYVRGPQTFDGTVTYASGSNGSTQELFAVATNGTVYEQWEMPHGAWSGWNLRGPQKLTGTLTPAPGSNGSIQELFGISATGTVLEQAEMPGGTWTPWGSRDGTHFTSVAFETGAGGVTQYLYAVTVKGLIWEDYEIKGNWSGWQNG